MVHGYDAGHQICGTGVAEGRAGSHRDRVGRQTSAQRDRSFPYRHVDDDLLVDQFAREGIAVLTSAAKFDLLPLSFCVSLLFAVPALRNIQPGVPSVAASAVIIIWTRLARRRADSWS